MRPATFRIPHSSFIALIAVWLIFFNRHLLGWAMFPDGDFTQQFYVFRNIAYRALASGQLPLWSDCFFAGYPFHADPQSQLFYPPIWIVFAALKIMGYGHFPLYALTLEAVTHYLLASLFTFLFLRSELAPAPPHSHTHSPSLPALLGALTFTYGGYLTGYPPLQTGILETVTWLPLILLSLRRLAEYRPAPDISQSRLSFVVSHLSSPRVSGSAFLFSIAFFAGHPQTFLLVFYLSLAYYLYRVVANQISWRWAVARFAVALILTAGLVSIQLLPQAEFLSLSSRVSLSFAELAEGFSVGMLAQFLFTDAIHSPLFAGLLPLALAIVAVSASLVARRFVPSVGGVWFWFGAALIGLLLSFGDNTPLYTIAHWFLPAYRLFRRQERLAMIVSFSLAVLAAHGAAFLLQTLSRPVRIAVGLTLAVMAVAGLIVFNMTYRPDLIDWLPRAQLMIGGLVGVAFILLARLLPLAENRLAVWGGAALALTAFNFFVAFTPTNVVPPFDPYPYQPILDPLRRETEPFFRVQGDHPTMQGHFGCGYGFKEWGGISPIRLAAWAKFEDEAPESLRWKLMAIRYLITWKNGAITREEELPPAERVAEGDAPFGYAKVYRLFEIPRRAWLVTQIHAAADTDSLFTLLEAPDFDPFSTALIHLNPPPPITNNQLPITNYQSPISNLQPPISILSDSPGHLSLSLVAESPALLVVSEAYYPGWAASVNGQPAPVYEADGYVLAVPVPAGDSTVELNYRSATLAIGAMISVVALLISLTSFALKPSITNNQ